MDRFDGHRDALGAFSASAVALGNFDGVHLGHRELLERASNAKGGGKAIAYTFEPHPARVLAPSFAPTRITSLARRLELIAETGVDACIVEPFTRELAALEPERFFTEILLEALDASHVVVGYDFTFGRERTGTTETLRALGAANGVAIDIVEPVATQGIVASSTKVRNFLGDGNLEGARLLLARNYDVDGVVVKGMQRGRELGYPTANIQSDIEIIVPTGIYATWTEILDGPHAGERVMAAASLGTNPTFEDSAARTLGPHLLDWSGDLYGARLRVEFVEYLRPEQRFSSAQDLVRAIDRDIEAARGALKSTESNL